MKKILLILLSIFFLSCGVKNSNDDEHILISTEVLVQNIYRPLFQNHGIITFSSNDNELLSMFRRIILNNKCGSDNIKEYSIYNPLTNEILKKYM